MILGWTTRSVVNLRLFFAIFRPYLNVEGKSSTEGVRFFYIYLPFEIQLSKIMAILP